MSQRLEAMLTLLLKGLLPPSISMALVIIGINIGSVYAWFPIGLTVGVLSVLFYQRMRKVALEDMRLMLHPARIRPVEEVLDDCDFLKPKP